MDKHFFFSAGFPVAQHFESTPTTPWHQHLLSSGDINCPSEQSPECYLTPMSTGPYSNFESSLSSMVSSSLGASNSAISSGGLAIQEVIGKLRTIGRNSGDVSTPYLINRNACGAVDSALLNSPPNLQLPIMNQLVNENLANIGITSHGMNPNLPFLPTTTDLGFTGSETKFSCYGSRSFNGRTMNNVESPYRSGSMISKAKLPRVSSSPLLKVAESPVVARQPNRTLTQFPPELRSTVSSDAKLEESSVSDSRKRKTASKGKVVANEPNAKRSSKSGDEGGKGTGNSSFKVENDAGEEKMNQKADPAELEKDYIHVRARRGQATDSHSLAERVRREKISERMKLLQDLVPGCNKVTGKALMLDEIISYVQQLQHNVEFLSMKLSSVNPTGLDITREANYPLNSSATLFGHQTQHANIPSGSWAVTQSSVDATLCPNISTTQSSVLDEFGHGHLPKVPSLCENDLHNLVMSFGTRQTEQNRTEQNIRKNERGYCI